MTSQTSDELFIGTVIDRKGKMLKEMKILLLVETTMKRRKSHKSSRFHGLLVISSGYKVISISCEGGAAGRD